MSQPATVTLSGVHSPAGADAPKKHKKHTKKPPQVFFFFLILVMSDKQLTAVFMCLWLLMNGANVCQTLQSMLW